MPTLEELVEELAESRRQNKLMSDQNQALQLRVQQLVEESERQRRDVSDFLKRFSEPHPVFIDTSSVLQPRHVRFYNKNILKIYFNGVID